MKYEELTSEDVDFEQPNVESMLEPAVRNVPYREREQIGMRNLKLLVPQIVHDGYLMSMVRRQGVTPDGTHGGLELIAPNLTYMGIALKAEPGRSKIALAKRTDEG